MAWLDAVPAILAAVAIFFLPGLLTGWAAGLRNTTLLGIAPLLSAAVLASGTVLLGLVRVPFNLLSASAIVFGVAIVVGGVSSYLRKRNVPRESPRKESRVLPLAMVTGILIAAVFIGMRMGQAIGDPRHISQTFDAVFHLNGVRYIVDTGDAFPLTFSDLDRNYDGLGNFYPNLWHAIAALVVDASGATVPVGVNATNLVIATAVWPASSLFLVRQVSGRRPTALVLGGCIVAGFAAFPYLLMSYGVLYPNALSVALLPSSLAMAALALRVSSQPETRLALAITGFSCTLPGIALAHPSALIALIVLGAPLYFVVVVRVARNLWDARIPMGGRVLQAAAVVAAAGLALVMILVLRPPRFAATWGPSASTSQALWAVVDNSQLFRPSAIALSLLALLGIVALLWTRKHRWLVLSLLFAEALYFLTATLPIGGWRYLLTGVWYSDVPRLVGLIPVVMAPVATFGLVWLIDLVVAFARAATGRPAAAPFAGGLALIAGALSVLALQISPSLRGASEDLSATYAFTNHSALLNEDEERLLKRLPGEVPEDAVVAGNPWTGASLVWALADRRALMPHIYGDRSRDTLLIAADLRDATPGSPVCDAIARHKVEYVLDFGDMGVFGSPAPIQGFSDLNRSRAMSLIDEQGNAKLYKVVGCG